MKHRSVLWAVLVGGSIAGALDILFAISFAGYNGVPPARLAPNGGQRPARQRSFFRWHPHLRRWAWSCTSSCRTCGQASL